VSIEENARIASELHAAMNNRDVDKAMSLFADDASYVVMPGGTCYTKVDIRKYFEKTMKIYEKFILRDIHPPVVSGSMLTHEYTIEAKLRNGPEGFIPAVVVIELSNGKISQVRSYIDKLEAAKQMASGVVAKRAVAAVAKQVGELINP
jgi:ketosteroid isomerase-like protein